MPGGIKGAHRPHRGTFIDELCLLMTGFDRELWVP